ncbi:MAG: hypothetical protein ACYDH5_18875 [Acidimicrobiales bacterium]
MTVGREVASGDWQDHGGIEWLTTSQRLVGRRPASELVSIWWVALASPDVELHRHRIPIQAADE